MLHSRPSMEELRLAVRQQMATTMQTERALMERALVLCDEGLRLAAGERLRRTWHWLLFLLAARSLNTLYVAHETLLNGFPVAAITLTRSAFEDVLTVAYVRRYPRDARFWLAKKYMYRPHSRKIPTVARQFQAIDQSLRGQLEDLYSMLSMFGHPRPLGLSSEIVRPEPNQRRVWVGPRFDYNNAVGAYYLMLTVSANAPRILAPVSARGDLRWWSRVEELDRDIGEWLDVTNAASRARHG